MAFANNINASLDAAGARAVAGGKSWEDFFPDDFDFENADPLDYIGQYRIYFDNNGQAQFSSGKNPFSGNQASNLRSGEKAGLLITKEAENYDGNLRATRTGREPKEWDHLVFGLTRTEANAMTPEQIQEWQKTIVAHLRTSSGDSGFQQMLVTSLHDDTDHLHFQVLLHKHPVDHTKKVIHKAYELDRNSEMAATKETINNALRDAGLPVLTSFMKGAFGIQDAIDVAPEAISRAAERVEEAGGIIPAELTNGNLRDLPVDRMRKLISPEKSKVESLLKASIKQQQIKEAEAMEAATATAVAQHALAAIEAKEELEAKLDQSYIEIEELKKLKDEQDLELKVRHDKMIELINELGESQEANTKLISDLKNLEEDFDNLQAGFLKTKTELEEAIEKVKGLEEDLTATSEDLAQTSNELAKEKEALLRETEAKEALAKANIELETEMQTLKTSNEIARKEISELKLVRGELTTKVTDLENGLKTAVSEKELADSKLEAANAQIAALVAQLEAQKATVESAVSSKEEAVSSLSEFKEAVRAGAQSSGRPPEGDTGFIVEETANSKKRSPVWPEGFKATRGYFGTDTIVGPGGQKIKATRGGVKLEEGILNADTAKAMIEYLAAHGAASVAVAGNQKDKDLLARYALEAGLFVEGYSEPKVSAGVEVIKEPTTNKKSTEPKALSVNQDIKRETEGEAAIRNRYETKLKNKQSYETDSGIENVYNREKSYYNFIQEKFVKTGLFADNKLYSEEGFLKSFGNEMRKYTPRKNKLHTAEQIIELVADEHMYTFIFANSLKHYEAFDGAALTETSKNVFKVEEERSKAWRIENQAKREEEAQAEAEVPAAIVSVTENEEANLRSKLDEALDKIAAEKPPVTTPKPSSGVKMSQPKVQWFERTGDLSKLSDADKANAEKALEKAREKGIVSKDVDLRIFLAQAHADFIKRQEEEQEANKPSNPKTIKPK